MKKMVFILFVFPYLLLGFCGEAFASSTSSIQLVINGQEVQHNSPPTVISGRTMVSLHSLQSLNLSLSWNNSLKQVTITGSHLDDNLVLTVGSREALFGGNRKELDVPAQLINNRVYVPLRFVGESFNSKVIWSQESRKVSITSTISMTDLEVLHKETDVVKARKLVFELPAINTPVLGNSTELSSNILYFPEGEVLRYFHTWGNHITYYVIRNNEKVLVWEAIIDGVDSYSEEVGKRPERGDEAYFLSIRTTEKVQYGRTNSEEVFYGISGQGQLLSSLILEIPNEVRTDLK